MIKKFLVIIVVLVLGAAGVWRLGFLPWGKEQAAVPGGYEVPLSTEDFEGALLGELHPQLDTTSSFLVRVRKITDAAQLTGEEQAALDADEGACSGAGRGSAGNLGAGRSVLRDEESDL